ncbi:hypothetical protein SUDANB176_00896 [Streptomyces sp. enrichment culture]
MLPGPAGRVRDGADEHRASVKSPAAGRSRSPAARRRRRPARSAGSAGPEAPSSHTGDPRPDAAAGSAQPDSSTSQAPATASVAEGSWAMLGGAPSNRRPPWSDTARSRSRQGWNQTSAPVATTAPTGWPAGVPSVKGIPRGPGRPGRRELPLGMQEALAGHGRRGGRQRDVGARQPPAGAGGGRAGRHPGQERHAAEGGGTGTLDDLEEERPARVGRAGEDLEQLPGVVLVGQDAQPPEPLGRVPGQREALGRPGRGPHREGARLSRPAAGRPSSASLPPGAARRPGPGQRRSGPVRPGPCPPARAGAGRSGRRTPSGP